MASGLSETPETKTNPLSLVETAEILERLMGEVEEADEVSREMTQEIEAIKSYHVGKVDRVIQVFDAAAYHLRILEEEQKILGEKIKRLKNRTETLKEYCLTTMKAFPNQVFKGKTKQLFIQKNGGVPSLKINFEVRSRMVDRIVTDDLVRDNEGLLNYIDHVSFMVINAEGLRQALSAGVSYPWAKLERGEHLRIR